MTTDLKKSRANSIRPAITECGDSFDFRQVCHTDPCGLYDRLVKSGNRKEETIPHPNKHIQNAIEYAESQGWRFEKSGPRAHAYGRLFCGAVDRCCIVSVYGTPRSPEYHARKLIREVDKCTG